MKYTRAQRYSIVNNAMRALAYRNRRDEPQIQGGTRMLAEELDFFEAWCGDLEERLSAADVGEWGPLIEAINTFRILTTSLPNSYDQ